MAIRVGKFVRVVAAFDEEIHDVSAFVGRLGKVTKRTRKLPAPWVVKFSSGAVESFWGEELRRVPGPPTPPSDAAKGGG